MADDNGNGSMSNEEYKERTREYKKRRWSKKKRQEVFLAHMAKTGVVTRSARKAGVDRTTAYHWRANDEEFAAEWDRAKNELLDELEYVVISNAIGQLDDIEGTPNPEMAIRILAKLRFREWGNVEKHVHAGDDKAPVHIKFGENMLAGMAKEAPDGGDGSAA